MLPPGATIMLSYRACLSQCDGGSGRVRSTAMIAGVQLPLHSGLAWYPCLASLLLSARWLRAVAAGAVAGAVGKLRSWPLAFPLVPGHVRRSLLSWLPSLACGRIVVKRITG